MTTNQDNAIRFAYTALRNAITKDDGKRLIVPTFKDIVSQDHPGAHVCPDADVAMLSVLSSHHEWEIYLRDPVEGAPGDLGNLVETTVEDHADLLPGNYKKADMLRRAIVEGDGEYSKVTETYDTAFQQVLADDSLDNRIDLVAAAIDLGEEPIATEYLFSAIPDNDEDLLHMGSWVILFARLIDEFGTVNLDRHRFDTALDVFTRTQPLNDLAGLVDPVDFRCARAKAIAGALEAGARSTDENTDSSRADLAVFDRLEHDERYVVFSGFGAEPGETLSDQDLDLVRLHDELCLEIHAMHDDPSDAFASFEPISRGFRVMAWRRLLNLDFPDKDDFLEYLDWDSSRNRPMRFLRGRRQAIAKRFPSDTNGDGEE